MFGLGWAPGDRVGSVGGDRLVAGSVGDRDGGGERVTRVAYPPIEELRRILGSGQSRLCIALAVEPERQGSRNVRIMLSSGAELVVGTDWFPVDSGSEAVRPDFDKPRVAGFGQLILFGRYQTTVAQVLAGL